MKHLIIFFISIVSYSLYGQGSCNYIEHGDFEIAKFEDDYTISPNNGTPNDSIWRFHTLDTNEINTIDLYRIAANNVAAYIRDTALNPSPYTFGTCIFNTVFLNRPPFGGKIFAGIASMKNYGGPNFPDNQESIALKLNKPLKIGDSFRFSFHSRKNQSVCSNFWVYIYGSKSRPCNIPTVTKVDGSTSGCGFQATLIDSVFVDSAKWKNFSFKFKATDSFKYFVTRMQQYHASNNDPNLRYGFFDDFELRGLAPSNRLSISANFDTLRICDLELGAPRYRIRYVIRLDTNTLRNAVPIQFEVFIPAAYDNVNTPIAGSPYNIRTVTIPANTISLTDSFVYTIDVLNNTSAAIHGQFADIILRSNSDPTNCLEKDFRIPTIVNKGDRDFKVHITATPSAICSDTITFRGVPQGGNAPYTYRWTRHASWKSDSSWYRIDENYQRTGIGLRVIDANNCSTTSGWESAHDLGHRLGAQYASNLSTLYEDKVFDLNGEFVVNRTIEFRNCHIRVRHFNTTAIESEIKVLSSLKLYNCIVTSCTEYAWKGIKLGSQQPSATSELVIANSRISDAFQIVGVMPNNGVKTLRIGISNNQFLDNHYGILLGPGHSSIKSIDVINLVPFVGNSFDITRTQLKQGNQTFPTGAYPFPKTMIGLTNVNYFSLGAHNYPSNRINASLVGIRAIKSNLDVKNFFINAAHYNENYPDSFGKGRAIDLNSGMRNYFFNPPGNTVNIQGGSSPNPLGGTHIYQSDYGLLSNHIVLNISNTNFKLNQIYGLHASSEWSLSPLKIYDNNIEEWWTIQEPMMVRSYYKTDVARNSIQSSSWMNTNAVSLHGFPLSNVDSVIYRQNNHKNIDWANTWGKSHAGFQLEARSHTKKINIFENKFELFGQNEEWDGAIGLFNTQNAHVYKNIIAGQGASYINNYESQNLTRRILNPLGIYANASTSVISCNKVNSFHTAMRYTGTNLSSTMSVNSLTDHDHGLTVDNGVSINPQLHQGNQWTGSLSWGAFNGNPFSVYRNQNFTVHVSNAFTGNPLWPSENSSGLWFLADLLANDKTQCDVPPPAPLNNVPIKAKLSVSNFDGIATVWERAIMQGGGLFADYNPSLVFQNQLQLYGVMQDRQQLISPLSPEANWLQANQSTALGQFYRLERAIDSVLTPSASHLQQIDALLAQRAEAMQAISSLDSLKGLDSLGQNLIMYLSQEDMHRAQIRQTDEAIEQVEQPRINAIYGRLDQLITQANEVQTPALYMDYLRQMYIIQLRYMRDGNLEAPAWDTIRSIAELCPLINEKAVYMARSLMMKDTSIYYNDENRCAANGFKQAGNKKSMEHIQIYPNPANNMMTLQFPKLYTVPVEVQIYNVMGREIWSETILPKQLTYEINTSKFQDGLYIVKIIQQGNEISNIKVHVIH